MAARPARPASAGASAARRALLGRRAEVVALLFQLAGLQPAHWRTNLRVAMHAASALAVAVIEGDVHQHDALAGGAMGGGKGRRVERLILHCEDESFIVKPMPCIASGCGVV